MSRRADNYWAHDHAESCVLHNSMRVSRRLMGWGGRAGSAGVTHTLRHAAYLERALLNGVLGTQRGSVPGAMVYMYPMGGGVSKAGIPNAPQGHKWSGAEDSFWCCQGSGVEACRRGVPLRCAAGLWGERRGAKPVRSVPPTATGIWERGPRARKVPRCVWVCVCVRETRGSPRLLYKSRHIIL